MLRIVFVWLFLSSSVVLAENILEKPSRESRLRAFSDECIETLQKRLDHYKWSRRSIEKKLMLEDVSPQDIYNFTVMCEYREASTRLALEKVKFSKYQGDVRRSSYPVRLPAGIRNESEWKKEIDALGEFTEKVKAIFESTRPASQLKPIHRNEMPIIAL